MDSGASWGDSPGVGEDLLAQIPDPQIIPAHLVILDIAPGEGGPGQIKGQDPFAGREILEPVGVQTDDGKLPDRLEEIGSILYVPVHGVHVVARASCAPARKEREEQGHEPERPTRRGSDSQHVD